MLKHKERQNGITWLVSCYQIRFVIYLKFKITATFLSLVILVFSGLSFWSPYDSFLKPQKIVHLTSPFQDILIFDFFHKISEKLFHNLQKFSDVKTASKRFLVISDFIEVRVGKLGIVVREKNGQKIIPSDSDSYSRKIPSRILSAV